MNGKNNITIEFLTTGLLMSLGILAEVYFGIPPIFVLIGAIAMTLSVFWLGVSFIRMKNINN